MRRILKALMSLASMLALNACIQGPWDFYPDNQPPFHGVYVYGYAIADRPLDQVCFERILDLAEGTTGAFAFYDSADVKVKGSFKGIIQAITLTATPTMPNCFHGDSSALIERGTVYVIDAKFKWDSAGSQVTSHVFGTAKVPAKFSIRRTAAAPSMAKNGRIPNNIFTLDFFASLPPNVRGVMTKQYGDTLVKLQTDTAALRRYIKESGVKIQKQLVALLEQDKLTYHEGDTLFYLNGALNTLSHYFTSDRSADVNFVLLTHRFDPLSERPETRFDSPFGLKPDSDRYYFPGDIRRLIGYSDRKGKSGGDLLDSMGFVNTWFQTGQNRIFFYGFERAYAQYQSTVIGDGNPPESRVKPIFNVSGGQGFFVGAVPDTFDLFIKVDSLTKSFSLPEVHGAFCRKEGWFSNQDCRGYYRSYCTQHAWTSPDCKQDAIAACLEADFKGDIALKAACGPVSDSAKKDTALLAGAVNTFCAQENYPTTVSLCKNPKAKSLESKGKNPSKQALWDYCLDHQWQVGLVEVKQCGLGLVGFCRDQPRLSETICRHADDYCKTHSSETLCK